MRVDKNPSLNIPKKVYHIVMDNFVNIIVYTTYFKHDFILHRMLRGEVSYL